MSDDDLTEQEEEQLKELMSGGGGYGYPKAPKREDVFTFFKYILKKDRSEKVANYTNEEIGRPRMPVRAYLDVANFSNSLGFDRVSTYLISKAEITSSTSMGRKGFLSQLFVTQIKAEKKIKPPEEKKGWFSKKTKEPEGAS